MKISLFRLVCILQFVLCGYMAVGSFAEIFNRPGWYSTLSFTTFCAAIFLVTFLLQVMHGNYPDTPLSISQKSRFNRLFIINFLLFSVLLAQNINDLKIIIASGRELNIVPSFVYAVTVLNICVTAFQAYIMVSMVKLRRALNKNFDNKELDLDVLAR